MGCFDTARHMANSMAEEVRECQGRVVNTYQMKSGATRRYRKCSAGHRFKTIETWDARGTGINSASMKIREEIDNA